MLVVLNWLLKNSPHQVFIFEAILALTNISSMNEDIREEMYEKGLWHTVRDAFSEENDKIDQAVMECQSNMMQCDTIMEHVEGDANFFCKVW